MVAKAKSAICPTCGKRKAFKPKLWYMKDGADRPYLTKRCRACEQKRAREAASAARAAYAIPTSW